jgi:hypothetical protein
MRNLKAFFEKEEELEWRDILERESKKRINRKFKKRKNESPYNTDKQNFRAPSGHGIF